MREAEHSRPDSSLAAARIKITEGISILNHMQKCIQLVDSSEHGCRVVQEYEANPLADDSSDEKRISRAYYHAERKIRKARRVRQRRFVLDQPQKSHLQSEGRVVMETAGIDKSTKISTDCAYYDSCNNVLCPNVKSVILNESLVGRSKSCLQH